MFIKVVITMIFVIFCFFFLLFPLFSVLFLAVFNNPPIFMFFFSFDLMDFLVGVFILTLFWRVVFDFRFSFFFVFECLIWCIWCFVLGNEPYTKHFFLFFSFVFWMNVVWFSLAFFVSGIIFYIYVCFSTFHVFFSFYIYFQVR